MLPKFHFMKGVNKKGISPLIVSVILVGFTILMAGAIFSWTQTVTEGQMRTAQEWSESSADYDYGAEYFSDCGDTSITDINCTNGRTTCYQLKIENEEDVPADYIIETSGNLGLELCGPFRLEPFQSQIVNVYYNNNSVGMPYNNVSCTECWLEADISPVNL